MTPEEKARLMRAAKKTPGRPPGAKNKFTDLKAAYLEAFEKRGGVQGLLDWAETAPDAFYAQISKMLPKEVQAEVRNNIVISWAEPGELPDPSVIDAEVIDTPPVDTPSNKVSNNEQD